MLWLDSSKVPFQPRLVHNIMSIRVQSRLTVQESSGDLFFSVPSKRRRRLQKRSQPARWKQCFSASLLALLNGDVGRTLSAAPVSNFKILIDVRLPFPSLPLFLPFSPLSLTHNTELLKSYITLVIVDIYEKVAQKNQAAKQLFHKIKSFLFPVHLHLNGDGSWSPYICA